MGPIRGQTRPLPVMAEIAPEVQRIDAKLNASIHNRFDIEVINAETGEVRQRAQAENVILNNCWTNFKSLWNKYIFYGKGTGTPSVTDTALFSYVGGDRSSYITDGYSDDFTTYHYQRKITVGASTAVGITLTEVGIATTYVSSTGLMTHAMLKDANGNTISITKTDTDIINIYSTVFATTTSFDNGNIHPFSFLKFLVGRASSEGNSTSYLEDSSMHSLTHFKETSDYVLQAVNWNTATKSITINSQPIRFDQTKGNNPNNTHMLVMDNSIWLCVSDTSTWYAPTKIAGEAIATGDGSKKDFATAFSLAHDATVYVDGVAQSSGVTVNQNEYLNVNNAVKAENLLMPIVPSLLPLRFIYEYGGIVPAKGKFNMFYNPLYQYGITKFDIGPGKVEVSDDMVNWYTLVNRSATSTVMVTVPEDYRYKKYWKFTADAANGLNLCNMNRGTTPTTNIHFDVAPAAGTAITADYTPYVIAKDSNHLFDFSLTIQLNEASA